MAFKSLHPISSKWQARFWRKVDILGEDECWIWLGAKTDQFYGYCYPYGVKGGDFLAHRVSYFLATGYDPAEFEVMHSCDDILCVNPKHLNTASHAENMADMRNKNRGGGQFLPHRFGETSSHAKLTDAEVAEIRRLAALMPRRLVGHGRKLIPGYWSEMRLAKKFGVGGSQIGRIIRGESRSSKEE